MRILPQEFPKHYISASYRYDVMSPMDKFLDTDKDNVFVAWKTTTVDQMSYVRDATLRYEMETLSGFSVAAMARHQEDTPAGKLQYIRNDAAKTIVPDITTAELGLTLRYARAGPSSIQSNAVVRYRWMLPSSPSPTLPDLKVF